MAFEALGSMSISEWVDRRLYTARRVGAFLRTRLGRNG